MQDFRNLKVWEKAHRFTLKIYKITSSFPKEEISGITSQIRRASYSIPANISEGCGRRGKIEFSRFLQIAMGSACEVEYFLILVKDLKFIESKEMQKLLSDLIEIKKMLSTLIKKFRT